MSCTATPPREVLQGVWISFCDQQEPRREVDEAGNLLVVLAEGAVGISADPQRRPMADISVRTTHGEVRVTGTVFTVHRHEDDSRVEVFRGTVSGQPAGRKERAFSVEEGSGAWLSTGRRYGLPGSLPNALVEGLLAVKYASRPSVHGDSTMDTSKPESSADPDAGAKGAKHRAHSPAEVPTLDALLAQARGCMVDQQWVCAADSYRTILKHYSTRWEAMSATISLAKIELRHLGRPAVARDHFAAYRKRYPSGPLMEEAIFGMAECEGRLGNPAAELKLLRAFVAQHPASSLAVKAHRRIAEIEAAAP